MEPKNNTNSRTDNRRGGPGAGGSRRGGPSRGPRRERVKPEYDQKVLDVRRVARVMKGGKRFSFLITMAIGNRRGKVGLGYASAPPVLKEAEKAMRDAKKHMIDLKLTKGMSISHELQAKHCSSRVLIWPAKGRGLAAGSSARAILMLAGVKDVGAKIRSKSKNKLNNARATMLALSQIAVAKA